VYRDAGGGGGNGHWVVLVMITGCYGVAMAWRKKVLTTPHIYAIIDHDETLTLGLNN
jgi:hypothetical protein